MNLVVDPVLILGDLVRLLCIVNSPINKRVNELKSLYITTTLQCSVSPLSPPFAGISLSLSGAKTGKNFVNCGSKTHHYNNIHCALKTKFIYFKMEA